MIKSAVQMRGPVKIKAKSPVITGRVPESVHRQIKAAAKKSGRSMSEQLAWLAAMALTQEQDLKARLRQAGYQPVPMDQGIVWAEPGFDWSQSRLSISIDAAAVLKEALPELVPVFARALGKFAKTNTAGGDQ
jgi:hypothetical protein